METESINSLNLKVQVLGSTLLFCSIFFLFPNSFNSLYAQKSMDTNRLYLETSSYLLQHAQNPIYWQRWNENLYNDFNTEEKLIVVSIGYSSCHWCHVMEKETFEDDKVANYMNQNFISIKVDREENPEIDNIYMTATQMMTGSGGWPLNVVCLPDGRPVYGGTYHRKEQWLEVLGKIQNLYENNKEQLYVFAKKVEKGIQEVNRFEYTKEASSFKSEILKNEMAYWSQNWDTVNGGEQQSQKFITPVKFNYIQQYQYLEKDQKIKSYFENTLENIANSGIVDHLKSGFYRYTVDPEWKIPHFEKMLYDNAQLLTLYSTAYKEFKNPLFKSTVYKTFEFLKKQMKNKEGGYYAAIDADNDKGEGRYYIFNSDEIKKIADSDLLLVQDYYRINLDKPFEKSFYHLRMTDDLEGLLKKYSLTTDQLNKKREAWEIKFESLKKDREFPLIDNKIITSWNALMISGLVCAFEAFGDTIFINHAEETFRFLLKNLFSSGKLMHTYQANEAKIEANLEDYAFTIQAALDLYKNTGTILYLEQANKLTQQAIKKFNTSENPFFTFTESPVLFSEIVSVDDNVIPSANAIMAMNLWKMGHLLGNEDFSNIAKNMLEGISSFFRDGRSSDYSQWAKLIAYEAYSFKEVVIVGPEAKKLNKEIQQNYLPNVLFQISKKKSEMPLLKDRFFEGETLIYVCENKVCLRPVTNSTEALKILKD
jgi:uncharacterized protein YyaL (SSP411 family)